MTAGPLQSARHAGDWRQAFVEEMGGLALEMGTPRAVVRVLAWMVVCDPPEQTAQEIQTHLTLSAGSVSEATRALTASGMLERLSVPGDRRTRYRVQAGSWERVLESRLRTLARLRPVAGRAVDAGGGEADGRLAELYDIYSWFEHQLDALASRRRGALSDLRTPMRASRR